MGFFSSVSNAVSSAASSVASNVSNAASNVVSGVKHGDIKQAGLGWVSGSVALGPGLSVSALGNGPAGTPLYDYNKAIGNVSAGNYNRNDLLKGGQAALSLSGMGSADLGVDPNLVSGVRSALAGPSTVQAARDPAGGVAVAPVSSSSSKVLMAAIVGGLVLIMVLKRRRK